ncbi:MAG: hypothetical protein KJO09_07390 [Gammaproteobacteria bacterium]|nr:hypothetical protein [Gammaproteobacteria bacterium]
MATNPDRWSVEIDDLDDYEISLVEDDLCLDPEGSAEPEQNSPHVLTPLQLLEARQEQKWLYSQLADWDTYLTIH